MAVVDNAERSRESRPILPPTKTLIDQRRVCCDAQALANRLLARIKSTCHK